MNKLDILKSEVITRLPAKPLCLPDQMSTALDTGKLWATIIAAGLAVVALIMVGIGMFFQQNRGDGGDMLKKLGFWIAGCVLVAAASGIAAIFIPSGVVDCVKSL